MNLLYILSEYLPASGGGIITFYANLLPQLVERGHRVKVLVANHASLDRAARVEDGVEVEYLQSSFAERARAGCKKFRNDAFWAFLPLAWGAFKQAKGGEGFDIVEATDWGLLFMPWVVSERKAKVVVSLHGSNGQVNWFSNPEPTGFDGDVVRLTEVAALRQADAIHANSRANAEFWKPKLEREIRVIPPVYAGRAAAYGGGVIADSVEQRADAKLPVTSHPLPATAPQAPKGLVVGRLQNWKGAEVLCKALEMLDGIQIEWVGGDTPWGKSGETASEYLKKTYPSVWGRKLYWRGPLPRLKVLKKISECSFLIVPSLWDVFNLTVAEGMEAAIPVICSRAAGAEMLIEHGRSGFLFDPAKPKELAERLKLVCGMDANAKKEMGLRAREAVQETLSEDRILALLEKSYAEVQDKDIAKKGDAWIVALVSPGSVGEPDLQPPFHKRAIRKIARILS